MAANSQFAIAIHVLSMLARSGKNNLKSELIAESVNTNPVVIRRLIGQLGQADLVISQTGAHGGTRLARRPADITLSEIYKAVAKGEVFALHPRSPNQDCPVGRNIESVLCNLQKEIDKGIEEKLSRYTLKNMCDLVEYGT
ncbi:MAG TPA: Rrf2 family transcriptional regulator [Pyrinomonadaceae bacterium]|nr:Rrf2 family transcriptional regulator [Pyrinomonadaceae bacterium]HMP66011.1 Rrf2 family transcriptional regulator [Pyrinomonadaceae bacterium]